MYQYFFIYNNRTGQISNKIQECTDWDVVLTYDRIRYLCQGTCCHQRILVSAKEIFEMIEWLRYGGMIVRIVSISTVTLKAR